MDTLYNVILLALVSMSTTEDDQATNKLLVIVCEGLHWQDLDFAHKKPNEYPIPAIDSLVQSGIKAAYLKPGFVSTTFPNLWTLVTGLTPEHHGIVHDCFYDTELDKTFNGYTTDDTAFYKNTGDPLWVTNEKHGGKTVSSGWPSGVVTMDGQFVEKADLKIPWVERVDFIVSHLGNSVSPANLGLLFFEEPGK